MRLFIKYKYRHTEEEKVIMYEILALAAGFSFFLRFMPNRRFVELMLLWPDRILPNWGHKLKPNTW